MGSEYKNFKYTYEAKWIGVRAKGIARGKTWEEALALIKEQYPDRKDIKQENW